MSEKNNHQPASRLTYRAIGLAIGLTFGGLIGFLIGNPAIFAGGTMVLGFAIGSAIDNRNLEK